MLIIFVVSIKQRAYETNGKRRRVNQRNQELPQSIPEWGARIRVVHRHPTTRTPRTLNSHTPPLPKGGGANKKNNGNGNRKKNNSQAATLGYSS